MASESWKLGPSGCGKATNHYFCKYNSSLDNTIQIQLETSYINFFTNHPIEKAVLTSGDKYGFIYFGDGVYGMIPSGKIVKFTHKAEITSNG